MDHYPFPTWYNNGFFVVGGGGTCTFLSGVMAYLNQFASLCSTSMKILEIITIRVQVPSTRW